MGRAEPAGDEADVGAVGRPEGGLEIDGVVADDHDAIGDEPERERLACVERAVPVGAVAADELAARDDDDRARAARHPLTAVAPETVSRPLCSSRYRVPSTFTTTFRGRSTESVSDFFVNRCI